MEWRDQDASNCSIGRTVATIGKPWVLLILREVFRGLHRFDEIRDHIGISEPVLSRRLKGLVEAGLLKQVPYRDTGQRTRSEYHLTRAGAELFPVLASLKAWGDAHLADPGGPATIHEHHACGAPVHIELRCSSGHRLDFAQDVDARPGPGARPLQRDRERASVPLQP